MTSPYNQAFTIAEHDRIVQAFNEDDDTNPYSTARTLATARKIVDACCKELTGGRESSVAEGYHFIFGCLYFNIELDATGIVMKVAKNLGIEGTDSWYIECAHYLEANKALDELKTALEKAGDKHTMDLFNNSIHEPNGSPKNVLDLTGKIYEDLVEALKKESKDSAAQLVQGVYGKYWGKALKTPRRNPNIPWEMDGELEKDLIKLGLKKYFPILKEAGILGKRDIGILDVSPLGWDHSKYGLYMQLGIANVMDVDTLHNVFYEYQGKQRDDFRKSNVAKSFLFATKE